MLEFVSGKQVEKIHNAYEIAQTIRDKETEIKGRKFYSLPQKTEIELRETLKKANKDGKIGKALIFQSIALFHYLHSNTVYKAINSSERCLHGACLKSIDNIADDLGMRKQNVSECIKLLEENGFVLKVKIKGIGIVHNIYYPLVSKNTKM